MVSSYAASQERRPSVILERLGVAHVAGQDVQRLVTAYRLHLPDRRPRRRGAGDEPGAQGSRLWVTYG
jgi:hypothetical protein